MSVGEWWGVIVLIVIVQWMAMACLYCWLIHKGVIDV